MIQFAEIPWRLFPAIALAVGGVAIIVRGVRRESQYRRLSAHDTRKALTLVQTLRLFLVGTSMLALSAAVTWQLTWLAILAIVIGAEEAFETTFLHYGLTNGKNLRLRP